MTGKDEKNDGGLKAAATRRSRSGRAGRGSTLPRIMVLGLLVIVAGGAALFWPRGGTLPTGIGENQTVVTTPTEAIQEASVPHSGEVDIGTEAAPPLTPEPGPATAQPEKIEPEKVIQKPAVQPTPEPVTPKPKVKATAPDLPKIQPQSTGSYAVQVGAFGQADNADKEAARLKALGWDTRVRAGNNASGAMVFRVWIAFFASRQEAQVFINQNSRHLPGAIVVHR